MGLGLMGQGLDYARVPAGRLRWRSVPPRGPSSGHMISSCKARTGSRGSKDRGDTLEVAGIQHMRTAASEGTPASGTAC